MCLCVVYKCFRVIQSCASMKRGRVGHDGNNCNKRPPLPLKRLHHTLDLLSPYLKRFLSPSEGPNTLSTLQIYFPPISKGSSSPPQKAPPHSPHFESTLNTLIWKGSSFPLKRLHHNLHTLDLLSPNLKRILSLNNALLSLSFKSPLSPSKGPFLAPIDCNKCPFLPPTYANPLFPLLFTFPAKPQKHCNESTLHFAQNRLYFHLWRQAFVTQLLSNYIFMTTFS